MEPRNWDKCSELRPFMVYKSCCSRLIYLISQNRAVNMAELLIYFVFKIKNTEKVFKKCSQISAAKLVFILFL